MSFTLRVIVGLVAGLAAGIGVSAAGPGWWQRLPAGVEPLGLLFVNAIRMTVIPLIASGLIVGVASIGDARDVGRLGVRALGLFVAFVTAATTSPKPRRGPRYSTHGPQRSAVASPAMRGCRHFPSFAQKQFRSTSMSSPTAGRRCPCR